jgi:hypothetical protein
MQNILGTKRSLAITLVVFVALVIVGGSIFADAFIRVSPGKYDVSVLNANGISESIEFTVTATGTPTPTPTSSAAPTLTYSKALNGSKTTNFEVCKDIYGRTQNAGLDSMLCSEVVYHPNLSITPSPVKPALCLTPPANYVRMDSLKEWKPPQGSFNTTTKSWTGLTKWQDFYPSFVQPGLKLKIHLYDPKQTVNKKTAVEINYVSCTGTPTPSPSRTPPPDPGPCTTFIVQSSQAGPLCLIPGGSACAQYSGTIPAYCSDVWCRTGSASDSCPGTCPGRGCACSQNSDCAGSSYPALGCNSGTCILLPTAGIGQECGPNIMCTGNGVTARCNGYVGVCIPICGMGNPECPAGWTCPDPRAFIPLDCNRN